MSTACSIILLLLLSLLHAMLLSLGAACSVMERLISQTNLRVLKVIAKAVLVLAAWRPRAGGTWEGRLVAQLQATRAGRSKPFSTGEVKYII